MSAKYLLLSLTLGLQRCANQRQAPRPQQEREFAQALPLVLVELHALAPVDEHRLVVRALDHHVARVGVCEGTGRVQRERGRRRQEE